MYLIEYQYCQTSSAGSGLQLELNSSGTCRALWKNRGTRTNVAPGKFFKSVQAVTLTQRVSACCLFGPFSVISFIQNPKFTEMCRNMLVLNVGKLAKDWHLITLPLPRDHHKHSSKQGTYERRKGVHVIIPNFWCQILEPVLMNSMRDAWRSRPKPNISASSSFDEEIPPQNERTHLRA